MPRIQYLIVVNLSLKARSPTLTQQTTLFDSTKCGIRLCDLPWGKNYATEGKGFLADLSSNPVLT